MGSVDLETSRSIVAFSRGGGGGGGVVVIVVFGVKQ